MVIVDSWSTSKIYPLTRSFAATNSFSRVTIGFSYSRSVSSVIFNSKISPLPLTFVHNEFKIGNWRNWYERWRTLRRIERTQEFEGAASGEIKDTCERKQTMKGREYKKETLEKRRRTCSSNLQKHLDSNRELLNCDEPPWASLQLARDNPIK